MSTPSDFHASCAGSMIERTWNSSPSTVIRSLVEEIWAFRLPRIESYLSRWASVSALVRSLTATISMDGSPIAARMMLRPMRPNPLIPTLTAIRRYLLAIDYFGYSWLKLFILVNGVQGVQGVQEVQGVHEVQEVQEVQRVQCSSS